MTLTVLLLVGIYKHLQSLMILCLTAVLWYVFAIDIQFLPVDI